MKLSKLFWQGLLTGNFRHWGAREWASYRKLFAPHPRIGIELETVVRMSLAGLPARKLSSLFSRLDSEWVKLSSTKELQCLFNTPDPKRFHKQVTDLWNLLKRHYVPTTGSVHINLQLEHAEGTRDLLLENSYGGGVHFEDVHSTVTDAVTTCRYEIKAAIGTINPEDLLIQLVAAAYYYRTKGNRLPYPSWYPQSPTKRILRRDNPLLVAS